MANKPMYETKYVSATLGVEDVNFKVLVECNAMAELGYRLVGTEGIHGEKETTLWLILIFELRE